MSETKQVIPACGRCGEEWDSHRPDTRSLAKKNGERICPGYAVQWYRPKDTALPSRDERLRELVKEWSGRRAHEESKAQRASTVGTQMWPAGKAVAFEACVRELEAILATAEGE